jgi:adenylate cyclase
LLFLGRFTESTAALDEGITIDDAVAAWEDPAHLLLYTERAGVVCRLLSGRALWFLGFADHALERVEAGLTLGQRLAHANSLAFALSNTAVLHNLRREFAAAQRLAETAIEIASEHRLPQWLAFGSICRGFALVGLGQQAEGIAQLRTGLAAWNGVGAHLLDTLWLGFTAEAYVQSGQFDYALTALDRAAEIGAASGDCHYQAELYRLRGAVLAETGNAAEAASWFQQAIDMARSQQRNRWSCAPRPASPASGAIKVSAMTPATSLRRSTAGSPRVSTPPISRTRRRCSTNSPDGPRQAHSLATFQNTGTGLLTTPLTSLRQAIG